MHTVGSVRLDRITRAAGDHLRLLALVPDPRRQVVVAVAVTLGTALAVLAQAGLLARILAAGAGGNATRTGLTVALGTLALVVGVRAALAWGQGVVAARAGAAVKARLRQRLLARAGEPAPPSPDGGRRHC